MSDAKDVPMFLVRKRKAGAALLGGFGIYLLVTTVWHFCDGLRSRQVEFMNNLAVFVGIDSALFLVGLVLLWLARWLWRQPLD
jgi:hypothetical protein